MSIDAYVEGLQNMVLNWIPSSVVPHLLQFIVSCQMLWTTFSKQAMTTGSAIYHSFCEPIFFFHKVGNTYVLNASNRQIRYSTLTPHEWEYCPMRQKFLHHEVAQVDANHPIPYLGASVSYNLNGQLEPICDMSEWISDQKIVASNNHISPQVLVSTYLYLTRRFLIYDYTNYVLHVTTDMAEDISIDLATGNPILESESNSDAESTAANSIHMENVD
jgi:hypothetical protein